jgi:hypothetical protein
MSFDLGNIIGSINKAVLPTATEATVPDTGSIEHELVHAQLAGTPDSNPAAATAERQGIIIIGGDVPLHPAVAPVVAAGGLLSDAPADVIKGLGDGLRTVLDGPNDPGPTSPGSGNAGGGFSGFLHTIANLGRG